mmetsp:Transcript_113773/g.326934  ORF Transcript_113773/g.326934 Transcript_113773/m.326934 type:complete len:91 (-) Transcript_113773:22-294(-)
MKFLEYTLLDHFDFFTARANNLIIFISSEPACIELFNCVFMEGQVPFLLDSRMELDSSRNVAVVPSQSSASAVLAYQSYCSSFILCSIHS